MKHINAAPLIALLVLTVFIVSCGGGTTSDSGTTTPGNASGGNNDTTSPTLSNIQVLALSANTASITWSTEEAANSRIEYGQSTNYGSTQSDTNMVTNHVIHLSGLLPGTTYNYRVISEDSAGNTAIGSNRQFTTQAQSATCQKGVDCYCDNHPELLFCEDFADGSFGNVTGGCSNNGGPWPNCSYMSHAASNSGGYRDDLYGINDNGAVLSTILTRSSGQMSSSLAFSLPAPLTNGEGSFGVLMKAGPTFWEAFASATKFIAFRPSSPDPRQVAYLRTGDINSQNGCTPGTYSVVNASGGGGAAINYDEFGNTNPWDANCQHTIKLGNNLANQWVYIEWEIHAAGSGLNNVLHIYLQDGTVMRSSAPVVINTTQYGVALFHWQSEPTSVNPDSGSYVFVDLMRVSTSFMGPPSGFVQ
jgi:hypothetical protein